MNLNSVTSENGVVPSNPWPLQGKTPLFKEFQFEDFAMMSLRVELHLLATSFGKDSSDPVWLREQVSTLFDQWLEAYNMQSDKVYAQCISELQRQGVLKGDDMSDRFFRVVTELAVEKYQSDGNLQAVDAFAKLVVLLVKYADGATSMTRVNLVSKVLGVVTRSLVREYENKQLKFDQSDQSCLY